MSLFHDAAALRQELIGLKSETLLIYLNNLPLSSMQLYWEETTVGTAEQKSSQLSSNYPSKPTAVGDTVALDPMRQEDQDTASFGTLC